MKNSFQRYVTSRSVGLIASEILSIDQDACIFGKTSRGIFIKTTSRWLIYLSLDHFQGPLTITINQVEPLFQQVTTGKEVRIASRSLQFPDLDLTISIRGSKIWQPAKIPASNLCKHGFQARLDYLAQDLLSTINASDFENVLSLLLGLPETSPDAETTGTISWQNIQRLQEHLRNRDLDQLASLLADSLGSGTGLTPSGDDFALGMLLTLNRWLYPSWKAADLQALNLQIIEAAYEKTTTLSANLIECATLELADERLVNILDWLATGEDQKPGMVAQLLSWGSSSGVAAFTGMAVALTA